MLRIGQITDLHLRHHQPGSSTINGRRSRAMPELLAAALADLVARGADAVVLTGDLLDVPDYVLAGEEAYPYQRDQWLAEVAADYALVRRIVEASGLPFLAVPGNHDAWSAFHAVFPEDALTVAGHRVLRFCDRQHTRHLWPRRVDAERRAFIAALGDPALPQVHIQHYVVVPELNHGYPHTYWEHAELGRRLAAVQHVRLVCSGHYHPGTAAERVGAATVTTCPAFTDSPHRYRLYTIDADGVRWDELATPRPAPRPAVFLDRDGVITVDASYRTGPAALRLIPGAAQAIARLHAAGFAVAVVTNQSCVGMGFVTPDMLAATHDRMCRLLRAEAGDGAQPDAVFASWGAGADDAVHADLVPLDDAKPSTVLVERARTLLGMAPGGWFVGDRMGDMECGRAAGCTPLLVLTGDGPVTSTTLDAAVPRCADIAAAVDLILARTAAAVAGS